MAVPSRSFVGIVVFGLVATCLLVSYTALVLAEYEPPPDTPADVGVPRTTDVSLGLKAVLVVASLLAVGLTWTGWRNLVRGARRDAEIRRRAAELKAQGGRASADGRAAPAPAQGGPPADPAPVPTPRVERKPRDEQPPGYQ